MNLFQYIKTRLSILDVIGEYTKLKKAGTYYKGHCPFHHEKTASFTVSPHKEIFYCFGCHVSGDAISFVAKIENCTQMEAAQQLIERYNIDVPKTVEAAPPQNTADKERYFQLCEAVSDWCHTSLKKSPSVIRYLEQRGFSANTIDLFQIGLFPGGLHNVKGLLSFMRSKSILLEDLLQAKIVVQGNKVLYSPFEDRIMFPIRDHLGRFCGFGGRIFKQADTRAKYYNSHENEFFNKGAILFGLDSAKKQIQKTEKVFLVEGYTDCIAMAQHGFKNTVATLGTSCTTDHLKILSRYAQQLYVLYDGDAAGQKAIMRLTELCWQVNVEPKVIQLPVGEDPASFLGKGGDIGKLADEALDIFSFFTSTLGKDFAKKPLNQKMQVIEKLLSIVKSIQDPLKRDIILQQASGILNIPFDSLKSGLSRLRNREFKKVKTDLQENASEKNYSQPALNLEKRVLFAILNNVSLLHEDNEDYLIACLPTPLDSILRKLTSLKGQIPGETPTFSQLFNLLDDGEKQCASEILLADDKPVDAQSFERLLTQFQKKSWRVIVQNVKAKLAHAEKENNTQEVENILNNFSKLKRKLLGKDLATKDRK